MENPGGTWLELLNSLAEKEIFFFKGDDSRFSVKF